MSDELEKKEPGLEERFAKIDSILDAMEDENVTLDRSFALYKEGLEQIKAAGQYIFIRHSARSSSFSFTSAVISVISNISCTMVIPVYNSAPAEGRRNIFIFSTEPIKPSGTGSSRSI